MSKGNKIIIVLLLLNLIGIIYTNFNLKPYSISKQNVQATIEGRDYKDIDGKPQYYVSVEYIYEGKLIKGEVYDKKLYDSSNVGDKISQEILAYKYKDGRNTKITFTK